jgi:hypothetical protein
MQIVAPSGAIFICAERMLLADSRRHLIPGRKSSVSTLDSPLTTRFCRSVWFNDSLIESFLFILLFTDGCVLTRYIGMIILLTKPLMNENVAIKTRRLDPII